VTEVVPERLAAHLASWIGAWPATNPPLVVANPRNDRPGWDGAVHPVTGVVDAEGRAAIGVPASFAHRFTGVELTDIAAARAAIPELLDRPDHRVYSGVFRWTVEPAPLPDAGVWLDAADPRVPDWLLPFGGEVLVHLDGDTVIAGVGVKKHDAHGNELAVVTDEAARGRGLARGLVAQAARRVLDEGAVPTYLHAATNVPSARVAEAAGFPERGWSVLGLFGKSP
jgi:GNAT superfamily N-acetyltransferase